MAERSRNTSPSARKTPPTPDGFVPTGDTSAEDAVTRARQEAAQVEVDASTMEPAPEDQTVAGQSFHNAAHVGSGTILPDGTYGDPLPDPMVARLAELKDQADQ